MHQQKIISKIVQLELKKLRSCLQKERQSTEVEALLLLSLNKVHKAEDLQKELADRMYAVLNKETIENGNLNSVFWMLFSLHLYDKKLIEGKYLAYAINRLTNEEIEVGGPYGTTKNCDQITNCLIAAMLFQIDVRLPNLEKYILEELAVIDFEKIDAKSLCFIYIAAPILSVKNKKIVIKKLANTQPVYLRSATHTAMYINIVKRLKPKENIEPYIDKLMSHISNDDHSNDFTFYFSAKIHITNNAIRHCLIAEALSYYVDIKDLKTTNTKASSLYKTVLSQTKSELENFAPPLNATSMFMWQKMVSADKNHEIVMMPHFFTETLLTPPAWAKDASEKLGRANFFNWIATVIYDDFIDEEGSPQLLPLANITNRLSLQIYRDFLSKQPFIYSYVEKLYEEIDIANAWEVAYTRASVKDGNIFINNLPDYGNRSLLAQRALGHIIGPLVITVSLPDIHSHQIKKIEYALKQYLIARQLNDDLHDWRKDLKAGQLNSVLTDLLEGIDAKSGDYRINELIADLEKYFLRQGIKISCLKILSHVENSREALKTTGLTKNNGGFINLLDNLQSSAEDALSLADNMKNFLTAYK